MIYKVILQIQFQNYFAIVANKLISVKFTNIHIQFGYFVEKKIVEGQYLKCWQQSGLQNRIAL